MGFLLWVAVGVAVGAITGYALGDGTAQRIVGAASTGAFVAVIAGYLADLLLKGDSVMHPNATTIVAAGVGAFVIVAIRRLGGSHRRDVRGVSR